MSAWGPLFDKAGGNFHKFQELRVSDQRLCSSSGKGVTGVAFQVVSESRVSDRRARTRSSPALPLRAGKVVNNARKHTYVFTEIVFIPVLT